MLQSLADAVLHHLHQHRLQVTDITSLSSDDQLAGLAAEAAVNVYNIQGGTK